MAVEPFVALHPSSRNLTVVHRQVEKEVLHVALSDVQLYARELKVFEEY